MSADIINVRVTEPCAEAEITSAVFCKTNTKRPQLSAKHGHINKTSPYKGKDFRKGFREYIQGGKQNGRYGSTA